jgi:hypothetical protein
LAAARSLCSLPGELDQGQPHGDLCSPGPPISGEAADRRPGPADQGIDLSRRLESSPVRSRLAAQGGAGT